MLTELLEKTDYHPGHWTPCPTAADTAAWHALPERVRDRWTRAGTQAAEGEIPALPLSLWLDFTKTGTRANYERNYFGRRRALTRLVMAACMGKTGLLPKAADLAWAICEETAWQLPAHNSYIRDTPQLPLPHVQRPIVDLFAAETAALLAMVHHLLGDALDAYAPGLAGHIAATVRARVLAPWRSDHFWWMGHGDEPMNNWTPWCTQNCLVATALLDGGDADAVRAAVRQAAASLDCFLQGYGPDGCCSEGAQYYGHAALTLYNALEVLCALAPGVFDTVWQAPKIKNMAEYIANMHIAGRYYLNFSDCSPLPGARGAREYRFAKRVGSAPLAALAARDLAANPDPDGFTAQDDSVGINLLYAVQGAFAEKEMAAAVQNQTDDCAPADIWYPSVGLRVCRSGPYAVGIKAGCNDDSHNHNDTGSVTLYKNGKPLLIDVGVESYTKKTFSPQRYEIWTMQSSWHNLPEFDPEGKACQQQPGAAFCAKAVEVLPSPAGLAMELCDAYGGAAAVPGLGSYRRTVTLGAQGLCLCDETDYPGTVALTLMSVEKPQVEENSVRFGALARAALAGSLQKITAEAVPITDPRLRTAWPDTLYRTRVYFTGKLRAQFQ